MTRLLQNSNRSPKIFCNATLIALMAACAACTTSSSAKTKWIAQGYLTPGPTGEPEVIGGFEEQAACINAVDNWKSSQVVGNPVFAECLEVSANDVRHGPSRLLLLNQ